MTALLSVRDLVVDFNTDEGLVRAVNGASFDLDTGEIVALVGESGCGKSVTALAILRLIADPPGRIVAGEIQFEGEDLRQASEEKIRAIRGNRIAMIFQEPMTSLNPVHTVGRQVAEPLALHKHLAQRDALEQCVSLLAAVNIAEPRLRAGAYPHQFSGGMRQRVMIAMGMGCVPDVIIADEPTTALDVTIQAQLLELLQAQVANHNTALLLITHNLGIVARYAHRVNVMYAGRVVEIRRCGRAVRLPQAPLHHRLATLGAASGPADGGEPPTDRGSATGPVAPAERLRLPSALSLRARPMSPRGTAAASGHCQPHRRVLGRCPC